MEKTYYDGSKSEQIPLEQGRELEQITAALEEEKVKFVRVLQDGHPIFKAKRSKKAQRKRKRKRKMAKASRKRNR